MIQSGRVSLHSLCLRSPAHRNPGTFKKGRVCLFTELGHSRGRLHEVKRIHIIARLHEQELPFYLASQIETSIANSSPHAFRTRPAARKANLCLKDKHGNRVDANEDAGTKGAATVSSSRYWLLHVDVICGIAHAAAGVPRHPRNGRYARGPGSLHEQLQKQAVQHCSTWSCCELSQFINAPGISFVIIRGLLTVSNLYSMNCNEMRSFTEPCTGAPV